jgi:gliding motility-associated-like protein
MNDGNYSITLQVTSNQGCQHSATLSNYITIHPRPRAAFGFSPPTTTILNPSISFIDSSMLSVYTSWSFGDGSPLADDLDDYFTHTYQDTGSFIVTQTVISQFGCIDSVKQVIRVEPEWTIFIPSAFTPNGDGKNERFMAAGMGVKDFEMRIFDRWGNILSVINEFKDGAGWDGKDSSTNIECPQGVYVYEINLSDIKNKKHKYVGKVVLLK